MHPLRRILPTLNCLYAIDAVARHLNFTAAARELGVSQPAVSKTIRAVEDNLGFDLFVRRQGGLAFTARGRELASEIGAVLSQLAEAVAKPGKKAGAKTLNVNFSPSFVSMWLLPRLSEFTAMHPDIAFKITENTRRPERSEMDFDFSSRLGNGDWNDVTAWEFAPEVLYAVASPDYIAAHPEVQEIKTLDRATLLHATEANRKRMDWAGWFRAAGEPRGRLDEGMVFSDYHAAIQAALLGRGVALGWEHLVSLHLKQGKLCCVAGTRVETTQKFYLVMPVDRHSMPHHRMFRDWVIEAALKDRERPPLLE